MTDYPLGNQIICRFCFTTRALTSAEATSFLAGLGLPSEVGVDQTNVFLAYAINEGTPTILSGDDIVHDATGAYHAVLTLTTVGQWRYWGYSEDDDDDPVAASVSNEFQAIAN